MTLNRIRTTAGACAGLSLLTAAVAYAAPDRTFEPGPGTSTHTWESEPLSGAILGVDSGRDNSQVKLPNGGNLTIKLSDFSEPTGAGADFDIRLYVANGEGDPEGDAIGEAITEDNEKETLAVKGLKPGNYNVEVNPFNTVDGTFKGEITAVTSGAAPAGGGGGTPGPAPSPGTGGGGGGGGTPQPAPAADQTPDAKIGKIAKKPKSFSGTASDDKGVAKVEVAVQLKKGKKCTQMTAKGTFAKQAKCDAPTTWITAKGTSKWSVKLRKKLKKGSYTLFARATDSAGQMQAGFTPSNKRAFRVK